MITITFYEPDFSTRRDKFTSELATAVENWKSFAETNNIDSNLTLIQSDNFLCITNKYFNNGISIECDEYPYNVTPVTSIYNNIKCYVLSKENTCYYPVDTIYDVYITSNTSFVNNVNSTTDYVVSDIYAYIYEYPILTYASIINSNSGVDCSINGSEISITLYSDEYGGRRALYTQTQSYKNMFSIAYLPTILNVYTTQLKNNTTLTFDTTKPSTGSVVLTSVDGDITFTSSYTPANVVEREYYHNKDYIFEFKASVNSIVQTSDFKQHYQDLISTTKFEQFARQFINNFPVNACSYNNVMVYINSFIIDLPRTDALSIVQWVNNNITWIASLATEDIDETLRYFISLYNGPNPNINAIGFTLYYVANYIANHTCINVLDYLLDFINNIPDTKSMIKHISCDVTSFLVDIDTSNVNTSSIDTSSVQTSNVDTSSVDTNTTWIIIAIVSVIIIIAIIIIMFISKNNTAGVVQSTK